MTSVKWTPVKHSDATNFGFSVIYSLDLQLNTNGWLPAQFPPIYWPRILRPGRPLDCKNMLSLLVWYSPSLDRCNYATTCSDAQMISPSVKFPRREDAPEKQM